MLIDHEIVEKIQNQDRKTILALYQHTFNLLMSNAVRYKNNREDQMQIVNASFLKIVLGIQKYKVGTAYFSWAKQIIKNVIIDDFRKNKNYKKLFEIDSEVETIETVDYTHLDDDVENEKLHEILNILPPATKLVFSLYAIDEFTTKEISKDLNISYETVKWHIKVARKKLRSELQNSKLELKK